MRTVVLMVMVAVMLAGIVVGVSNGNIPLLLLTVFAAASIYVVDNHKRQYR